MNNVDLLSCNISGLSEYVPSGNNQWAEAKAKHVFRRLAYGAPKNRITLALVGSPNQLVDNLIDTAYNLPLTPAPFWSEYTFFDFNDFDSENRQYFRDWKLLTANNVISEDLRGRLAMFWFNHFVAEVDVYGYTPFLYKYYNTIERNTLGNFKILLKEIGLTAAMLLYLNGFENTNENPNENYGRELYELFTLGEGNGYSQQDIIETAKALTGYNHQDVYGGEIYFDSSTFLDEDKTIFGQTGNWNYDDVIDILFEQRSEMVAFYICKKLYRYFVGPEVGAFVEDTIIRPLATTFIDNDFEIVPVLQQLFKSEHFFDEKAIGVIIKSPLDVIFQFINETELPYTDTLMQSFTYQAGLLGQKLFDPPNVAGWQGDEDWISNTTLIGRWELLKFYVTILLDSVHANQFVTLARDLSYDSADPEYITRSIIDFLNPKPLFTESDYTIATDIFKWEVPQNYYDEGLWSLDWEEAPFQVYLLLTHIGTIPEFQLR